MNNLDGVVETKELPVRGIDHLAIAVRDLDACVAWFESKLGFKIVERRTTNGRKTGMISAVMQLGPLTFVLVQGTDRESQVSRFVEHYGPGVQHVAIRVEGLPNVVRRLEELGVEFATTIIENGSYRQAFTKRDRGTGVMFELIERGEQSGFADQGVRSLFEQLEAQDSF
jgi:methylmalonyl-CoA/ethylmalonyl-CoA epimerase